MQYCSHAAPKTPGNPSFKPQRTLGATRGNPRIFPWRHCLRLQLAVLRYGRDTLVQKDGRKTRREPLGDLHLRPVENFGTSGIRALDIFVSPVPELRCGASTARERRMSYTPGEKPLRGPVSLQCGAFFCCGKSGIFPTDFMGSKPLAPA